jgi:hypothetical protein
LSDGVVGGALMFFLLDETRDMCDGLMLTLNREDKVLWFTYLSFKCIIMAKICLKVIQFGKKKCCIVSSETWNDFN